MARPAPEENEFFPALSFREFLLVGCFLLCFFIIISFFFGGHGHYPKVALPVLFFSVPFLLQCCTDLYLVLPSLLGFT